MTVKEKLNMDLMGLRENGAINIVAFGDSVTHGSLSGCNNYETVYWNRLKQKLNAIRDSVPVNVINAGIGGVTAKMSVQRIERDVLCHHPDLVIVCFGLNDVNGELNDYLEPLKEIFTRCKESGAEVIFMTPNMLNTYVAEDVEERYIEYAGVTASFQTGGRMDLYMTEAVKTARESGVEVCDCYKEWKKLYESGADITKLLANRINHPVSEMHELVADMLLKLLWGEEDIPQSASINTMYQK